MVIVIFDIVANNEYYFSLWNVVYSFFSNSLRVLANNDLLSA